ncbi:hypothetical protein [uncultured Cetobacterium sp.]|uniref:hypothetical protein n=1 Tax=uncultured Cetobacterium sp. TaxID=527638 RepID=UPI002617CE4D|nr:hypothetical protein [uncultured Cetobacterium sp.]
MIFKPTKALQELKKLNSRKNTYFQVGVFGKDDSEMVKIAAIHEFGGEIKIKKNRYVPSLGVTLKAGTSIIMPERKWLTITFERNKEFFEQLIKVNLKKIASGTMSIKQSNEIIAITLASYTKKEMGKGVMAPKHRSGTPMVDSGRLRQSVGTRINFSEKTYGLGED